MSQGPTPRGSQPPDNPGDQPAVRPPADEFRGVDRAADAAKPAAGEAGEELPERMLGEFRILRRLGKGGMAEVFLAEQTSLKRNVAVKVLREERLSDESHLRRFKTEAMAAAALSHPNIVQVFMVGEQEGAHYIAQEYVQGMNLREYVTRKGPPEMGVAVHIMKQAASALQAAHSAGIVHRDIKPENIMLTRRGDVKIADFGLAQLTLEGERVDLTQVGVTMGTPLYMSPEQVNGRKLDARSDIYSLGVTCYHMLSGSPPFRGETALSVAVQHLKQEPERLEKLRADLPAVLCRIVHKMMSKNPDKRYQYAQDVLKDLKRLTQGGDGVAEAPVEDNSPIDEHEPPPGGGPFQRLFGGLWRLPDRSLAGQVWILAIVALVTGAAMAGAGWLSRPPDPFASPAKRDTTPKMESVYRQYFTALNLKTDAAAWQAVIDYPDSRGALFKNYARRELAYLHLSKGRLDDAQKVFDDLSRMPEPQWQVFGQAGLAYILNRRGEYDESQKIIEKLKPHYDALADHERMLLLFRRTVEGNFEALKKQMDEEFKKMLQDPGSDAVPQESD